MLTRDISALRKEALNAGKDSPFSPIKTEKFSHIFVIKRLTLTR